MWGRIHRLVWWGLVSASVIGADPAADSGSTPLSRARAALGARDLETASAVIKQQLDQKPDDVEWLLLRAELLGARGRAAEALAETRAIRDRYPESRLARMKEAQ